MENQKSNAQAILEKLKKKKEEVKESIPATSNSTPTATAIVSVVDEVSVGQALNPSNPSNPSTPSTPLKATTTAESSLPLVPSRTFNYWSKAPNTEIALSNKPAIKFKGNAYQTSDSHEISILDDMVKRIPNVFSKVG